MMAATSCFLITGSFVLCSGLVEAAINDYCMVPPFVTQNISPLVVLDVGRDHKLYYQAYSDAADLNGDGKLDIDYTHTIDYYGYFDSYKCYTYYSSGTGQFEPTATSADKFCASGYWSGNFLNWVTMSRMDVLRKVLYGGNRIADTTSSTVLQRVYTPQDAHSWGKEFTGRLCKSGTTYTHTCSINTDCDSGQTCANLDSDGKYLTPLAAATAPTTCTSVALPAAQSGKVLVARYRHSSGKNCGTGNTQGMINSYEPGRLFHPTSVANLAGTSTLVDYVTGFDDASLSSNDYANDYNIIAVTNFTPDVGGAWQFAVDGDDDVEVQVGGTVVAQYLGCHGYAGDQSHNGTITLTAGITYTLVARHFEKGGGEGVRVWFKRPADAVWTYVKSANLTLSAPTIVAGNECAIETVDFITTGTPTVGGTVVSGSTQYHLFCNTTLSVAGTPLMRVLQNMPNRIWDWSAKERPVCDTSLGTPTDYTVSAKVCAAVSPDNRPSDKKDSASSGRETNCQAYGTTYKPTGLLQKYSQGDGTKVCSKNLSKTCTTATTDSSDCGAGEGLCIYRAPMYFGMISGSYMKNESGGVLRKNLGTMLDEVNLADGTFITGTQGIINTFENMHIVGYRYGSDYDYNDASGGTCGWITSGPLQEGQCRNWGNPIGEMYYETLRYFAGKGAATTDFVGGITNGNDSGLNLPLPSWGYTKGATTYQPYDMFPSCSKPFALILSDINPSYDSDQIPGSSFKKNDDTFFSEDTSTLPVLGLGTVTGGFSLLNQLANTIGTHEPNTTSPIDGNNWFIGQSGSTFDNLCTSKNIQYLSTVRGLCPEEPTKRGSYYTAALAYYGKTMFKTKTGKPDLTTYAVAMSSPVADLKIKAGSNTVTMVPIGKSISGCLGVKESCIDKCTATTVDANGIHLGGCATDAFCPSNQIVNFFVDDIRYNTDKDVIYASFRINYEDVEQGADHDMDAIVKYEICTTEGIGYGSCVNNIGTDIEVKLSSDYAAGCIDQVLGFIISGTQEDGTYLVVKDKDVGGSGPVSTLLLVWSKRFTPNGNAAGFLKNPLWYAAKWGGFVNSNQNTNGVVVDGATTIPVPDLTPEWANNDGVNPDNYFLVVNPLKLETQLDKALTDILTKTASGTAASILSNQDNNGAVLLQAIFYPSKYFQNQVNSWLGELHGLFYYVDPFLLTNSIREDSNVDNILNLKRDYVTRFSFDTTNNQTVVQKLEDTDGNGTGDVTVGAPVLMDDLHSVWKAGKSLWSRTSARTIYTVPTSGTPPMTPMSFSTANAATLQPWLNVTLGNTNYLINFINGTDQTAASFNRSRAATINSVHGTWRLGDIVSSTPRLQSAVATNNYDLQYPSGYLDSSYGHFIQSNDYKNRNMAYVGANDGMLHAFNLGKLSKANHPADGDSFSISKVTDTNGNGTELGKEMWGFIPKNALPYLQYLADPNYNHIYYVDGSPTINDAAIHETSGTGCTAAAYWLCDKKTTLNADNTLDKTNTSWRTVLIVGMGLGGASRNSGDTCSDCVKTPITGLGYSSYTALDVTDPTTPLYMWEFSDPALGYTTPGAAIVRIGNKNFNGRWYAIFASGPTGPIDTTTHQFMGKSDQSLKIFIVDLKDGTLVRTIDTGPSGLNIITTPAFAGSMTNASIDTDRTITGSPGYYSDDAIYLGYVQKDTAVTPNTWTKGGVLRILTQENIDATTWTVSKVIDGIGPVTSAIGRIQEDPRNFLGNSGKLWLYFGTGRYFYKEDDSSTRQSLYGLMEPCYQNGDINQSCSDFINNTRDTLGLTGDLQDQTSSILTEFGKLPAGKKGWVIDLAVASGSNSAQRVITDSVPLINGVVLFTAFKPNSDICNYGGSTSLWAVTYNAGGTPPEAALQGQGVIQLSTGSFQEVLLNSATFLNSNGRESTSYQGVPPPTPPAFFTKAGMLPQKKILRIQEN